MPTEAKKTKAQQDDFKMHIDCSAFYLKGPKAAVTFASKNFFKEDKNPIPLPGNGKKKYRGAVPWGTDNNLPQNMIDEASKNPIASPSLEFKIDLAYGGGVKFGIKNEEGEFIEASDVLKNGDFREIKQFFADNDIPGFYAELISDLQWFYNGFVEIILNKDDSDKRKIVEISSKEAAFSRWESANPKTGMVENHFYSAKWPQMPTVNQYQATPVIWSKNPTLDLKRRIGREKNQEGNIKDEKQYRYIIPIRLPSPGRIYYPRPYWYAIIESGWLDFANKIPEFKKALMTNVLTVNYHVQIRDRYFEDLFRREKLTTKKEQESRYKAEKQNIENFLSGSENAGKTIITYYKMTPDGKVEIPDIKIEKIDTKIGGEFIEDSHEASAMIAYAMRVHPAMIGVIPGKTNSNLSGSDKRELLQISQSLQKRLRDLILKPLYMVKEINNWPAEVEFSIPDIVITTLDTGAETKQENV